MASPRASTSLALSLLLAAAAALLLACPGAAQSSPAPSSGGGSCMTEIVSLAPCLGYMSGNTSKPSSSCCSSLSSVVTSNPRCLCMVLGGGASSLGVTINNTRALELPGACNVKTPPASQCKSVGVPVPSPAAPATPATTPATPATPATTPATPASPGTPSVPSATPTAGGTVAKGTENAQSSGGSTAGKATSALPVAVVVLSAAFALLHA
ncbi:non-specific lipid transfer protein GPI-anchored 5-like [Phragmites australis]|uniref:non-specific lipid transfer protein GPI-anchored 5-like n=1 Tax=Phragmites australis TaxID=29695 RepID=UPI002D7A23BD|nr:non-specific lipid transfer protein GPI-anchored 5-like [Phragmites australis]